MINFKRLIKILALAVCLVLLPFFAINYYLLDDYRAIRHLERDAFLIVELKKQLTDILSEDLEEESKVYGSLSPLTEQIVQNLKSINRHAKAYRLVVVRKQEHPFLIDSIGISYARCFYLFKVHYTAVNQQSIELELSDESTTRCGNDREKIFDHNPE